MGTALVIACGLCLFGCLGGMAGMALEGWARARRQRRARKARLVQVLHAPRDPVDYGAKRRMERVLTEAFKRPAE